jgi:hypothetical protein
MKTIQKLLFFLALAALASCGKDNVEQEIFDPTFTVPEQVNKINTAAEGYTLTIEASPDVSWKAAISTGAINDWITLTTSSGKGAGAVVFDLKANEGNAARSVELIFTATSDRSKTPIPDQKCIVTQIGTDPSIEIAPANEVVIPITANPDYTIVVTANVEWTATLAVASGAEGWISITAPAPVGTPVSGVGEVKLNILENTDLQARSATVTIASTQDPALKKTLSITQPGITPSIILAPTGTESLPAGANDAYKIEVTANIEWQASLEVDPGDEADWIVLTAPEGPSTGNGSITLAVRANNGETRRTARLHVRSTAFPDDPALNPTLTLVQINAGAMFSIVIPDYMALSTGTATMNISTYPSGASYNLPVEIISDALGATIKFIESLPAGNYLINSITYDADPPISLGAIITTDAVGSVTFVEHYDAAFNCFGGNFEGRPISVRDLADLNTLRTAVNAGHSYAGLTLKQSDNIALGSEWDPIGNAATNPFAGIYDGNNLKITQLSISSGTNKALFGVVGGIDPETLAIVKNLTVEGSGGPGADVTGSGASTVAGLIATVTANTHIENCINRANITATGGSNVGGLTGTCTGDNISLSHCYNYGAILGATGSNGGIVAALLTTESESIRITDCHNHGHLTITSAATTATGGIAGRATHPTRAEIQRCSNRGDITLSVNSTAGTGGIIGALVGNVVVQESYNLGSISAFTNTGGISGLMNNNAAMYNCYSRGNIEYRTSTAVNNSGIAGNMTNAKARPVEYCYNAGSGSTPGTGNQNYGGIASSNTLSAPADLTAVKECFYETGKGYAGGIGGNLYPPSDVPGHAEGKSLAEMQTSTPYTINWDTDVWVFAAGQYPTLKNNPE